MSLSKILLTVAVVVLIWGAFKYVTRLAELRAEREARRDAAPRPDPSRPPGGAVEDMVRCRVCDTWQPARSAKSCGRSDCPY